jgi:hypothetical protein
MQWTSEDLQWGAAESQWMPRDDEGPEPPQSDNVWPTISDVQRIYLFTLTGSPDGMDDVTIPVTSCQMRRRNGQPTHMSVVVPDYDVYIWDISARTNGEMVFSGGYRLSDDSTQVQEIARVSLETIRTDAGPISRAITLTGHATMLNHTPTTRIVSGSGTRTWSAGKLQFRCDVDLDLAPGDTAVINEEICVVGSISYVISAGLEYMDITEA